MLDSPDLLLVNLFKIKVFLLPKISNYVIFLFISNIKFLPRNCWQLMVLTQSLSGMFRNWPDSRQSALTWRSLWWWRWRQGRTWCRRCRAACRRPGLGRQTEVRLIDSQSVRMDSTPSDQISKVNLMYLSQLYSPFGLFPQLFICSM